LHPITGIVKVNFFVFSHTGDTRIAKRILQKKDKGKADSWPVAPASARGTIMAVVTDPEAGTLAGQIRDPAATPRVVWTPCRAI